MFRNCDAMYLTLLHHWPFSKSAPSQVTGVISLSDILNFLLQLLQSILAVGNKQWCQHIHSAVIEIHKLQLTNVKQARKVLIETRRILVIRSPDSEFVVLLSFFQICRTG